MDCGQIKELLGRFHDGELDAVEAQVVSEHVADCAYCNAELAALKRLTRLIKETRPADPPISTWRQVLERLSPFARTDRKRQTLLGRFSRAAAILVMVGLGAWGAVAWWNSTGDLAFGAVQPVDLEPYLNQGRAALTGPALSVAEIKRQVDFKVFTALELPHGYQLKDCSLECKNQCKVVRYRYERDDDVLLLLQFKCCHPVQHGKRQVFTTRVNGKIAQIVQCGNRITASWRANGTAVSLIGPEDMCELVQLMTFVDERFAEGN